jgi:hypothetical protein
MRIEQIPYTINWKKFYRGYSVFIPCIDPKKARAEINAVADRLDLEFVTKIVIEEGVKGLRVWRV